MKKVLTILLALLVVTGVVFAEPTSGDLAGDASLTIKASQEGVLKHKITKDEIEATAGFDNDDDIITEKEIDLKKDTYEVGYYSVLTNKLATEITSITLTIPPLKHTTLNYYIPYVVSVGEEQNIDTSTEHTGSLGIVENAPGNETLSLANFLSTVKAGDALRVESRSINVTLSEDYDAFVPAGNYQATLSVVIVAP